MSNIFQDVLTDVNKVQEELLGPTYNYASQIKMPSDIGMSSKGDLSTLAKDITGLIEYVKALVSGGSKATKTSYLGDKFFLKTGGTCKATDTGESVDRYIYINNVPEGNIPFISSAMNVDFKEFRGLIPGTMSQLNNFNPFTIMQAFMMGSNPDCQKITLQTIDVNNNKNTETQYVTTIDLQNMDPCDFIDKRNPITNLKCNESFKTMKSSIKNSKNKHSYLIYNDEDDILNKIYYISLGFFLIYIIYKISKK